jgi:hypothetical protein
MIEEIQVNLSEQILAAHAQAHAFAEQAKGYASDAVAKAIECGQLLIQQKAALGHGSWLDWLARNLPEIKRETVRKYMQIAKVAHGSIADADKGEITTSGGNLKDASSLRQAFVAIGLLPVPENKPEALDPNKPWVRFTRYLDGFRLWFNKRTDEDPLKTWPEDSRRILKNELRWFAQLYEQL